MRVRMRLQAHATCTTKSKRNRAMVFIGTTRFVGCDLFMHRHDEDVVSAGEIFLVPFVRSLHPGGSISLPHLENGRF
jgi:hypothetical protein